MCISDNKYDVASADSIFQSGQGAQLVAPEGKVNPESIHLEDNSLLQFAFNIRTSLAHLSETVSSFAGSCV